MTGESDTTEVHGMILQGAFGLSLVNEVSNYLSVACDNIREFLFLPAFRDKVTQYIGMNLVSWFC